MKFAKRIFALLFFCVACSPLAPPPIDPTFGPPPNDNSDSHAATASAIRLVSNVSVAADRSVPRDRLHRFAVHKADEIIRRAVFAELGNKRQLNADAVHWLAVTVTSFRLRSTATSVWVGTMAGSDHITARIDVMNESSVVRAFEVHVASIKGGIFFPSSSGRLNNLARALAREISEEM